MVSACINSYDWCTDVELEEEINKDVILMCDCNEKLS